MQQAKDNQRVSLIVRRYLYPNNNTNQLPSKTTETSFEQKKYFSNLDQYNQTDIDSYPSSDFRANPPVDHGIRHVTLQKMNDNQSFGFVIISSQNKAGATVGK